MNELRNHLEKKEISLLIGPRQAGKTTLMLLLKKELEQKGQKVVFLNLDIEADRQFFVSQAQLLKKVELEIGKTKGYVFIDEIQRKRNAGVFLKGLYDMNLPYKFIVSGSGSVELKENIHESLAGRKRIFELGTLSFEEFVNHKTDYKYEGRLADFFSLEEERTSGFLTEYLDFGGYPRVILAETTNEKRQIIAELYQSYLEKDISFLLGVRKTESFTALVRIIASQLGQLVNIAELSATLGLSMATVKNYLWYMEKTFLLDRVTPYYSNIRKEITKSPVYYFFDLGMRNYALGVFGSASQSQGVGFVFQNLIFRSLKEKTFAQAGQVHFWRTTDKVEVDFAVRSGQEIVPVEVKYQRLTSAKLTKSFKSFLTKYRPKRGYFIHLAGKKEKKFGETLVEFLPFYQFLLQEKL